MHAYLHTLLQAAFLSQRLAPLHCKMDCRAACSMDPRNMPPLPCKMHCRYRRFDDWMLAGKLRDKPSDDGEFIGPDIKPGDILHALSCAIILGYVEVSTVAGCTGYVKALHLCWKIDDDTCWWPMTDFWWYTGSHEFRLSDLWIKVSKGNRHLADDEIEDFSTLQAACSKQQLAELRREGYTYVALMFGNENVHITLGYLPMMGCADLDKLERALSNGLWTWIACDPMRRPEEILKFRKFDVKDAALQGSGYFNHLHNKLEAWNIDETELKSLTSQGLLDDPWWDPDKGKTLEQHVLDLRKRDLNRYHDAIRRAEAIVHSPKSKLDSGVIYLSPDSGLGESLDVQDICHYLTDIIWHFPSAWRHGKLAPPKVISPESWHATLQPQIQWCIIRCSEAHEVSYRRWLLQMD